MKDAVFHCFTGDIIFAEQILEAGWMMSFTGASTYAKSDLDDVIRMMPVD